jgi:hypothetical protein
VKRIVTPLPSVCRTRFPAASYSYVQWPIEGSHISTFRPGGSYAIRATFPSASSTPMRFPSPSYQYRVWGPPASQFGAVHVPVHSCTITNRPSPSRSRITWWPLGSSTSVRQPSYAHLVTAPSGLVSSTTRSSPS